MAEIRINATGGVKLYDADDSHYAQIVAGTITSNVDAITLGHDTVTIADNLSLGSDSAVLKFGADGDTTLTHTDGTGLTLNSTNKLCFNDASQFIQGSSATVLSIGATDEIDLTATAVDLNGTLDVSGTSTLTGAVTMAAALSAKGGIVVNEDQGNVDFRVESDDKSHIFFCDASANVCGTSLENGTAPQFGQFHIRNSSAGQATMPANGDELIIEGNGHMGMTILSAAANTGNIFFGDNGDNDIGGITYNHNDNSFAVTTAGAEVFRLTSDGQITTRAETAPDVNNGGITLNHGGDDGSILSMKNSDVAHGMTDRAETDTYGFFKKGHNTNGGLTVCGLTESESGLILEGLTIEGGVHNAEDTTADGIVKVDARKSDNASYQSLSADGNAFTVNNNSAVQFIVKGDGEIWSNQTATVGTYDTYNDAQLVRSYDLNRGGNLKGLINSKFDKFIKYNEKDLMDAKLIGKDSNDNPTSFVNLTGMSRLHNGAIWQQYEKHERLLEAVYDLAKLAVGEDKANAILEKHEVKRLQ